MTKAYISFFSILLMIFVPIVSLKADDIKTTPYDDWVLITSPVLRLHKRVLTDDGSSFVILDLDFDEILKDWTVTILVNPSADKSKEILITFPNGVEQSLSIDVYQQDYCKTNALKKAPILINQFKNNPDCNIAFIDKKLGKISLPITLRGFNKAYAALQEKQAAASEEKITTSRSKSTVYGDWVLEYFDFGNWANVPSLSTTISEDSTFLHIKIYSIKDILSLVYVFTDTVDQANGLKLSFPDRTKINLRIERCTDTHCGSLNMGQEAKDILQDMLSFENETDKDSSTMKKCALTFIRKTTNEEVSIPFSVRGLNEAYKALEKAQKATRNIN